MAGDFLTSPPPQGSDPGTIPPLVEGSVPFTWRHDCIGERCSVCQAHIDYRESEQDYYSQRGA